MAKTDKCGLWLFKNDHKNSDTQPDMTGNGEITVAALDRMVRRMAASDEDTIPLECAAWSNVSKAGKAYLSVQLDVVFAKGTVQPGDNTGSAEGETEDNIPF